MAKLKNPTTPVVENTNEEELVDMDLVAANAVHQASDFWERNQKYILGIIGGVLAIVALVFVYNNFFKAPKEAKAAEAIAKAQTLMAQDSFEMAIKGGAGKDAMGFAKIAKTYSGTASGNMANLYAGQCYMQLGNFPLAISYLEAYSPSDEASPAMVNGLLGDAYSETNKMAEALKYYEKAAVANPDEFFTPYYLFKLGLLNEKQKNYAAAKTAYDKIKSDYPESMQGRGIDIYIGRVEGLVK